MDLEKIKIGATKWVEAWNRKDIEKVMEHYADEIVFYSPTVRERWGIAEGKLKGKTNLQNHFLKGFALAPKLQFKLIEILTGIDGILIVYERETGKIVADYVVPDLAGRALLVKVFAQ